MSANRQSSRLSWLAAAFGDKISGLWGRLSDLRGRAATNPKVFTKFLNLLNQIAVAKDEESEILSEIEAVERKHKFQRKNGYLKRATPAPADAESDNENDAKNPRHGWLLLAFWYLMMRRGLNHKKQSLTVD